VSDRRALDSSLRSPPAPVMSAGRPLASVAGQRPPVRLLELELSRPIPDLTTTPSQSGKPYQRALVLVRLHREPLGLLPLDVRDGGLPARELAQVVWTRFHPQIARHLAADGEAQAQELALAGLSPREPPPCAVENAFPPGDLGLASVVVTTCDRPSQLLRALDSLLAQAYPAFELIVVDNRPSGGLTRDAVAHRYGLDPRVRYVAEPRVGLAAARNAGLAHARGEIVAFTDDDVTVDPHWLSWLALAFLRDDAACVTGLILPLELETRAQLWFEQFGGFGKGFERRSYDLASNRPPDALFPYAAGCFGSGANTAFRTGILRELGGFAVELGAGTPAHGGEDLDAYLSVIRAGHRLVYEPRALLRHRHHRDLRGLSRQIHRYGIGLTAVLTKRLVASPEERRQIVRRLPAGLAYAIDPRSAKNTGKGPGYPPWLTLLELAGMLRGPVAYALARWVA
jgi:glycosyltransferase involved in cell wall biosynthesis